MSNDPYWNSVVLAMHMDGANASTTFTDLKGHAATPAGNAQISTAQSKFGGASALFDGTGDYVSLDGSSDFALGTGDFTIEFFVRPIALTVAVLVDFRAGGAGSVFCPYIDTSATGMLGYYINGAYRITATTALNTTAWHHVAVCRASGVTKLWLNGTQEGSSWTDSGNMVVGASRPIIGANGGSLGANSFNGYIDDLRVTKGVSRYTATFTPPTAAFSNQMVQVAGTVKDASATFAARTVRAYRRTDGALSGGTTSNGTTGVFSIAALDTSPHYAVCLDGAGDPCWNSVVLAMHMDDTGLTDGKSHAVTLGGNAARSATQSKFGGHSAVFDGVDDYLSLADSADWDFGTGDFTVEAFVNFTAHTGDRTLVGNYLNSTTGWSFQRTTAGNLVFNNGDTTLLSAAWTPSDGTWYHLAVCRSGANLRAFVDGVQMGGTVTNTTNITGSTEPLVVGCLQVGASYLQDFNGYIDDLRITKGVARYIAEFTPPDAAFPDAASTPSENAIIFDNITPI